METKRPTPPNPKNLLVGLTVAVTLVTGAGVRAAERPAVITLTQTGCQFIESEGGVDRGYTPASKADCERSNGETAEKRLAEAEPLRLKPGRHVFRVVKSDVPYELGFYLRGAGITGRLTLPKVAGAGILQGQTKDFEVDLKEGTYLYSCPLNTTPDYTLVVER